MLAAISRDPYPTNAMVGSNQDTRDERQTDMLRPRRAARLRGQDGVGAHGRQTRVAHSAAQRGDVGADGGRLRALRHAAGA
jgi:hypothetical protein